MRYEFEKLLRGRKLSLFVTLTLLGVYLYFAFNGSYTTFSGVSLENFWKDSEYRHWRMSQETELVDDEWIENVKAEYKAFLDENVLSPEEIAQNITTKKAEGYQIDYTVEEALHDPYNFEYAFAILPYDAYHSRQMEYTFLVAFNTYVPLAENPVQYIHDKYKVSNYYMEKDTGMTYAEYMGYSATQAEDYWDFIDTTYGDLELTIGYNLGWDVLCSVMQFLPFTLGMALIVVLSNLFSQEQMEHMPPILRTTKHGRSTLLRRKLIVTMTVVTCLWLFFQVAMLLAVSLTYTLKGASCTAMCFSGKPSLYCLTWIEYYLITCIFSYLGTMVFSLFVCCMSSLLKLRLSMPINLVLTLLSGIPLDRFCYADKAFKFLDKLRVLTPAQLMASYPTLQVYQSFEFGSVIIQLPYMMAIAIVIEAIILLFVLHRREGGK